MELALRRGRCSGSGSSNGNFQNNAAGSPKRSRRLQRTRCATCGRKESFWRSGAEVLVHGYLDGVAPGEERAAELGVKYEVVRATGVSEDVALLLAQEKGSELIVAVGTHFNLIEFLERNRAGMSSTFVTRLKVGEILIDAKGVSRLASRQVGIWPLVLF